MMTAFGVEDFMWIEMTKFRVMAAILIALSGCAKDADTGQNPVDAAVPVDLSVSMDSGMDSADLGTPDAGPNADSTVQADMLPVADAGPLPCDPPLALTPENAFVASYDLVTFVASGGTGNYRFNIVDAQSGALLNELTGAYLAGPNQGGRDRIQLTDVECVGEASATAYVVEDLRIIPAFVEVPIGHRFTYTAEGGSGVYVYRMAVNGSGGAVTEDGEYTAGAEEGSDTILVEDPESGLETEITVDVRVNPTFEVSPRRLFMPVGSSLPVVVDGGSGIIDVEGDSNAVTFDDNDGMLTANNAGRTRLTVTDRFAGLTSEITVDVAEPLLAPLTRYGRALSANTSLAPGDLNGDGFADAILGYSEGSSAAFSDGIVAIYAGSEMGLSPTPVQILSGSRRSDMFGRDLAIADFNGDGVGDLAVGAPNDDTRANDAGAVHIFSGIRGAFFSDEPILTLVGRRGSDLMGQSVGACDFNGDGFADLAMAGIGFEQRDRDNSLRDQGAVFVYLGGPEGLAETPSEILDGFRLDGEGNLVARSQVRIGVALTTGDFDGDQLCDVAVSSTSWAPSGTRNVGMVQLFRGRAVDDDPEYPDPGGLGPDPVRIIVGIEEGVNESLLGRRLASGDLNGDGRADLLIGQHGFDGESGNNHGAARVFLGGPLEGPVRAYVSASEADWTVSGPEGGDGFGYHVSIGDFDGDSIDDVILGAWGDEGMEEGDPSGAGGIHVYPGVEGGIPAAEPSFSAFGFNGSDQFGESVSMLGDANGDGHNDLFVTAARNHDLGVYVGRPYMVSGQDGERLPLDLPGEAAGHRFGNAVALADLNGDGSAEVLVGAPRDPNPPSQVRAGSAWVYVDQDVFATPAPFAGRLVGSPDLNRDDNFGIRLSHGDFDGDGQMDIAVTATGEEYPGGLDGTFIRQGECRRASASGAVYVYRGTDALQMENRPAAIAYSRTGGASSRVVAMADVNGDGRDDLILGGPTHDQPRDSGRIEVILGRPYLEGGDTPVLCDPTLALNGVQASAQLGISGTRLGDLNGDGCEDFAVGELRRRANDSADAGVVRVIFGWGGAGCPDVARSVLISPGRAGEQFGGSLALWRPSPTDSGWLVAGAYRHRRYDDNRRTGGAYLIELDWILDQTRRPVTDNDAPIVIIPRGDGMEAIEGTTSESSFGATVAAAGPLLVIGEQFGRVGGDQSVGGARIYGLTEDGAREVGRVIGETENVGARLGHALSLGGEPLRLLIGGFQGSGIGTEGGSAYLFDVDALGSAP